jgi:hypothetical protein
VWLAAGRRFNALPPRARSRQPRGHAEIKTLSNASAGLAPHRHFLHNVPPSAYRVMELRFFPAAFLYYSLVWLLMPIAQEW